MILPKDYESITIHGWMINKLHLEGVRLLIFAAVWNYCLGGSKIEWAWLDNLCAWINACGYKFECEDFDSYLSELFQRGLIGIDKEGLWIMRNCKELN